MQLQRGKFLVNNIEELNNIQVDEEDIKKVIKLAYMGKFEYEGNAIPVSRMFIEYYNNEYIYYPTKLFSKKGQQMYFYIKKDILNRKLNDNHNFIVDLINKNYSLWEYIKYQKEEGLYDFWWDIEEDYFVFFGKEKIDIINYFINKCYNRDGGKKEIKKKLKKIGYEL